MTAFVFPGQGSQFVGMSKDFHDNFNVAKTVFEEISDYVKIDLKKIIFDDNKNLLNLTNFTQISIFTASIAIFKTLENNGEFILSENDIMLGHSLGEYTALACSKKMDLKECSQILIKRGELMHTAVEPNKSGMAALIGCNAKTIEKIIVENKMNLEIANDNSPLQVVISGSIEEIDKNENIFLKKNIKKFVKLNVSAAFHSHYMQKAQNSLASLIEDINFNVNKIKIISNYSSLASNDENVLKNNLKNQMANKVRWTESIENLEKIGENKIFEIGPGKVLSGLIKRISNKFDIKSISKTSDI